MGGRVARGVRVLRSVRGGWGVATEQAVARRGEGRVRGAGRARARRDVGAEGAAEGQSGGVGQCGAGAPWPGGGIGAVQRMRLVRAVRKGGAAVQDRAARRARAVALPDGRRRHAGHRDDRERAVGVLWSAGVREGRRGCAGATMPRANVPRNPRGTGG